MTRLSSPRLTAETHTIPARNPVHFYSLFAQHQPKIAVCSSWVYVVFTTTTSLRADTPADWHIARCAKKTPPEIVYSSRKKTAYQPPMILTLAENRLGIVRTDKRLRGLYLDEFDVLDSGDLRARQSRRLTDTTCTYFTGAINPENGNIVLIYWDSHQTVYILRRLRGEWLPPEPFAVDPDQLPLYSHLRWHGDDLHHTYTITRRGPGSGNYHGVCCLRSGDQGHTWQAVDGTSLNVPLSADQHRVTRISQAGDAPGQFAHDMLLDPDGRVYIAYQDGSDANWLARIEPGSSELRRTQICEAGLPQLALDGATFYYVSLQPHTSELIYASLSPDANQGALPAVIDLGEAPRIIEHDLIRNEAYAFNMHPVSVDDRFWSVAMLRDYNRAMLPQTLPQHSRRNILITLMPVSMREGQSES